MRFDDRVVLVTGAEQGIGRALALAFAREGARVAIDHPGPSDRAAGVRAEAERLGARAMTVRCDLRDTAAIGAMVAEVERGLGPIDVLVNNAAIFPRAPILETSDALWDDVLAVNLRGTFACCRAVAPSMVARGRGRIVNLSSTAVWLPRERGGAYAASKAAVVGLSRVLALELASAGVTVNVVAPGVTDTAQARAELDDDALAALGRTIPLGRIARPEDVTGAVLFLASDEAAYVTGQVLPVNGGRFMR